MSTPGEAAIAHIACTYCGAEAGERCHQKSGRTSHYSHSARTEIAYGLWLDGFYEGQEDIVGALDSGRDPWGSRYIEQVRERMAT